MALIPAPITLTCAHDWESAPTKWSLIFIPSALRFLMNGGSDPAVDMHNMSCCFRRWSIDRPSSNMLSQVGKFTFPCDSWTHEREFTRMIPGLLSSKKICAHCLSENVYLSHRKNNFEKILSVFLIRPFRCQECDSRFFKFVSPNSHFRNPTDPQGSEFTAPRARS